MASPSALSRRGFLTRAAGLVSAGLAVPWVVPASALAGPGANERIGVGYVGVGRRGLQLMGLPKEGRIVAVCDVHRKRADAVAGAHKWRAYDDYRKMLEAKDVDAVIVATPDHWHSPASILACEAGKHVYVEKPISHNIREGRLLVEAAARNKVLVQHGTQSRSTGMMIEAVKLLREGTIGTVMVAKCWNIQRRGSIGRGQDCDPPPGQGDCTRS